MFTGGGHALGRAGRSNRRSHDMCHEHRLNFGLSDLVEEGLGTDPKNAFTFFPDVSDGDLDFDFDGKTMCLLSLEASRSSQRKG